MKRLEFEELRQKVFGAIEHCQKNMADDCTDCPYERDSCFFDLSRDRDKLLHTLNAEYERLSAEVLALTAAHKSTNVDVFEHEQRGGGTDD